MTVKVLYAHHDGGISGSAISLRNLLAALDRQRFLPRVALFSEGPARSLYEALDIQVDIIKARPFWTAPGSKWIKLGYYFNLMALLPNKAWEQYLTLRNPDLLHANDKSCIQAGFAAKKLGIPVIWHLRSSYYSSNSKLQSSISARIIRKSADALIAISEDEIDRFESFSNLHIIYNSLDFELVERSKLLRSAIRSEFAIQEGEMVVGLVVTNFTQVRGGWDFLEIAGIVNASSEVPLRFVVVAPLSAHIRNEIQALAQKNGISEHLILTGFRSDALAVIAAMDILVVCNHHGVLGRPPFEAMSVGTAVVAWQGHSGRSSVISNGDNALVTKRGDRNGLAQLIIRLTKDTQLRQKIAMAGMEYAKTQFQPSHNARKIEAVYENVLLSQTALAAEGDRR